AAPTRTGTAGPSAAPREVNPRVRLQLLRRHRGTGEEPRGSGRLHPPADRLRLQGGHRLRWLRTTHPGAAGPGFLPPPAARRPGPPAPHRRPPGSRLGSFVWVRPDQGAGSGAVDRKAEEGGRAEPCQPTTTRRGAVPGPASPA